MDGVEDGGRKGCVRVAKTGRRTVACRGGMVAHTEERERV